MPNSQYYINKHKEAMIIITIGILLFHHVEELDFVGPYEVVSYINKVIPASARVLTIAASPEPVQSFNGLKVIPDITMDECPQLDVLIVPGGKGRLTAMHDTAIRSFISRQLPTVKYLTSVCTGAFILAEAGLLAGKRATTYHTALDELAAYTNVTVEKRKVVQDGNIITAAGVSSGLELGFYLLSLLFGRDVAQTVADRIEYDVQVETL